MALLSSPGPAQAATPTRGWARAAPQSWGQGPSVGPPSVRRFLRGLSGGQEGPQVPRPACAFRLSASADASWHSTEQSFEGSTPGPRGGSGKRWLVGPACDSGPGFPTCPRGPRVTVSLYCILHVSPFHLVRDSVGSRPSLRWLHSLADTRPSCHEHGLGVRTPGEASSAHRPRQRPGRARSQVPQVAPETSLLMAPRRPVTDVHAGGRHSGGLHARPSKPTRFQSVPQTVRPVLGVTMAARTVALLVLLP